MHDLTPYFGEQHCHILLRLAAKGKEPYIPEHFADWILREERLTEWTERTLKLCFKYSYIQGSWDATDKVHKVLSQGKYRCIFCFSIHKRHLYFFDSEESADSPDSSGLVDSRESHPSTDSRNNVILCPSALKQEFPAVSRDVAFFQKSNFL